MSSRSPAYTSEITALPDDVFGCPCGCALALWSMPETEAIRWECQVARRGKRQDQCPDQQIGKPGEEP